MQAFFCLNNYMLQFKTFFAEQTKFAPKKTPTKQELNKPTLSVHGAVKHRHQGPLGNANSNGNRKHLNLVPKYAVTTPGSNKKIEDLKKLPRGSGREFVCNTQDIGYIVKTFLNGAQPIKGKMYTLGGKMGIQMYFDNNNNCWKIKK